MVRRFLSIPGMLLLVLLARPLVVGLVIDGEGGLLVVTHNIIQGLDVTLTSNSINAAT